MKIVTSLCNDAASSSWTHRLSASTSPRCAQTTSFYRRTAQHCSNIFTLGCAFLPTSRAGYPGGSRARAAVQGTLPDGLNAGDQDDADVTEPGGRDYLQLSDLSDSSLQVRMVQWYPGHIARAERQLKSQLSMVDVVLEVRDARIPVSTCHPQVATWVGAKPRLLIINRADQIAERQLAAWRRHYLGEQGAGQKVFWTDGRNGDGVKAVRKELLKVAAELNAKRAKRGLQPRPVRACVIGFPNIGKSALINRLVNRRAVASAPKPGVTRQLRWVRVDEQLDLLDAPGVIPASFRDQLAAQRLAMCNDIGEAAYLASAVGAALVLRVKQLAEVEAAAAPATAAGSGIAVALVEAEGQGRAEYGGSRESWSTGRTQKKQAGEADGGSSGGRYRSSVMAGVLEAMRQRYGLDPLTIGSAEDFVVALAGRQYGGDVERAGVRLLTDYRNGALGRFALELPADLARRERREAGLQAAADRREWERLRERGETVGDDDSSESTTAPYGDASAPLCYLEDLAHGTSSADVPHLRINSSWVDQAEAWARTVEGGTGRGTELGSTRPNADYT